MAVETQVAIIGAVTAILGALIPVVVQYLRSKKLQISESQERLLQMIVQESARSAEEFARTNPKTSAEKLQLASEYATKLLAAYKLEHPEDLQGKIQANIRTALAWKTTK